MNTPFGDYFQQADPTSVNNRDVLGATEARHYADFLEQSEHRKHSAYVKSKKAMINWMLFSLGLAKDETDGLPLEYLWCVDPFY